MVDLSNITKNGKAMFLAYDQGLEHGPIDFNDESADPNYILDIGVKGGFTGVILQKGIAEKYFNKEKFETLPLIVKLNGKTSLVKSEEPYSPLLCTVDEAIALGAQAVGLTVYVGSGYEEKMLEELGEVVREAHTKGIPVIGWMYPRGKNIVDPQDPEIIEYAARVGLEVGADLVKVFYPGSLETTKKVVEMAGKTGVVVSGGLLNSEEQFLNQVKTVMEAGAMGVAVGRNIWQRQNPLEMVEKVKKIVFNIESRP